VFQILQNHVAVWVVLLFAHDLLELRNFPFVIFLARAAPRSVDEAIRRRFTLIPFTVTVPPEERDPDLFDKLKEGRMAGHPVMDARWLFRLAGAAPLRSAERDSRHR
jgi:hypothetical protein